MQDTLIAGMVAKTMEINPNSVYLEIRTKDTDFSEVYQRYATPIYRYIIARVGNPVQAEDLTSLVFMDALKSWDKFSLNGNIPAWLFTIARNKIVDHFRRKKQTIPLDDMTEPIIEENQLLQGLMDVEKVAKLKQALSKLQPKQQELLQLRFAGELTYSQIGKVIGKSEAAVKMAIHRLLDRLQNFMEQDDV